jgi:hypothetical protein
MTSTSHVTGGRLDDPKSSWPDTDFNYSQNGIYQYQYIGIFANGSLTAISTPFTATDITNRFELTQNTVGTGHSPRGFDGCPACGRFDFRVVHITGCGPL